MRWPGSCRRAVVVAEMFGTGVGRDNRSAVRAVGREKLDLVGMSVYGPKNAGDKVLQGAHLHP